MKHLFQIKEQNRDAGSSKSRISELEEELRQAHEALDRIQQEKASEDSESELKDTKAKLRIITTKFANVRKERDTLKKENRSLQSEILELQSNMRQMVPGYHNISASFPMLNEITDICSQFYKCDCQDVFFEVLGPELSMEGIVYYFRTSFSRVNDLIKAYFTPAEETLKRVIGIETLEGPIMNVLRKSYQVSWKKIYQQCVVTSSLQKIVEDIQRVLRLGDNSQSTNTQIFNFMQKLSELLFTFWIHDPPVKCGWDTVGKQVEFSSLLHDALDGFIRPGDQCIIVVPPVQKTSGEVLVRSGVLHVDYEMNI
ncbi:unnamed protein product [Blepharisma stoltei]|uniref:Uncharacterized protein n=1 Tax=Blepharisma stoltei TaxID=1481888 RepID=A0AAU9IK44_9CILI|nr:unnamed protein product [Blepharisma stoltei]